MSANTPTGSSAAEPRTAPDAPARPTDAARRRTWPVAPHWIAVLLTVLLGAFVWFRTGVPVWPVRWWVIGLTFQMLGLLATGLAVVFAARLTWRFARKRPITRRRIRALVRRHFGRQTLKTSLAFLVVINIALTVLTTLKQAFPFINPRLYDDQLLAIERWLHGGLRPAWFLASSNAPSWWIAFLDATYYLWFAAMPLVVALFLSHRHRVRRLHFLAAFATIWLVGVLPGMFWPSMGPCYTDPSVFPAGGMLFCGYVQDWLWDHYVALERITASGNGNLTFGCGLMAMPSMHVALCALYVLFCRREGLLLRWGATAYLAVIFVGSLYSGWHYAIDGYAGAALAAFAFWVTAAPARRWAVAHPTRPAHPVHAAHRAHRRGRA